LAVSSYHCNSVHVLKTHVSKATRRGAPRAQGLKPSSSLDLTRAKGPLFHGRLERSVGNCSSVKATRTGTSAHLRRPGGSGRCGGRIPSRYHIFGAVWPSAEKAASRRYSAGTPVADN